ncbi:MAG TPA: DUF4129 domain-containing protein [Actinophytocola sp.]|jgi:hypothetical protein|uniref:DUF4129 domain-containing protein n=1 Tax=Actinophytocola sp. TaxID=1872138 RepID=UPI002F92B50E
MRSSRIAALCAVAALLLFAVVSARGKSAVPGHLRDVPLERGTGGGVSGGGVAPDENAFKVDIVDELQLVQTSFVVGAMILLLIAFALFVRRLQQLRKRKLRLGVGVQIEEEEVGALESSLPMRLRRAAAQARTELAARAGGPPGDAVIAAWLRLEEAAEREGAGREPHQTATEFTAALLERHTTSEPALDELRELYQRARFGPPDEVTETDADAAVAALDRILVALGEPAVATTAVAET